VGWEGIGLRHINLCQESLPTKKRQLMLCEAQQWAATSQKRTTCKEDENLKVLATGCVKERRSCKKG